MSVPPLHYNLFLPIFRYHSLQIHCFGLFGPKSIHILGLGAKSGPYMYVCVPIDITN